MNSQLLTRFIWLEYRKLRSFWISMAILAALLMAYLRGSESFAVALAIPALFCAACGATMFAAEREDGTIEFLRGLPLPPRAVLAGKTAFALVGTALLIVLLLSFAQLAISMGLPGPTQMEHQWGLWGMAAFEGLAWGIFWSLLLKRPMQAALLGIASASVAIHAVVWSITPAGNHVAELRWYTAALPYRLGICAILFAVDWRLAGNWLAPRTKRPRDARLGRPLARQLPAGETLVEFGSEPSTELGRLIWQSWRQSAGLIAAVGGLGAAVILCFPFQSIFISEMPRAQFIAIVAALFGSCVFFADQQGRGRQFLAAHGVRPRLVWLSRQVVFGAAFLIWIALVYGVWLWIADQRFWQRGSTKFNGFTYPRTASKLVQLTPLGLSLCWTVLAYTSGQLVSMLVRSPMVAAVVAVVLTSGLCMWTNFLNELEVGWVWSIAPIPVVLLLATLVRSGDWLGERGGPRAWGRITLALAIPAVTLFAAVCAFRIYEIPDESPVFSAAEASAPATPDERKTADLYRQAAEFLVPGREGTTGNDETNAKGLALLREAGARAAGSFYDSQDGGVERGWKMIDLARTLTNGGSDLAAAGQLDEARQRLLAALRLIRHLRKHAPSWIWGNLYRQEIQLLEAITIWSGQPNQSSADIQSLQKLIRELQADMPPVTQAIKADYDYVLNVLAGARLIYGEPVATTIAARYLHWNSMPWERIRSRRIVSALTAYELEFLRQRLPILASSKPILDETNDLDPPRPTAPQNLMSYFLTTGRLQSTFVPFAASDLWWEAVNLETHRRAAQLRLAIESWKADHQELPVKLQDLVGPYIEQLPVDAYRGRPFYLVRCRPDLPEVATDDQRIFTAELPNAPFLWNIGWQFRYRGESTVLDADAPLDWREWARVDSAGIHDLQSEREFWSHGEAFKIP